MVDVLKPCKYILNEEECPYGNKCRFGHEGNRGKNEKENFSVEIVDVPSVSSPEKAPQKDSSLQNERSKQKNCYFYLHSYCKYGSNCKFNHPRRPSPKKNSNPKSTNPVDRKRTAPADPQRSAPADPQCSAPADPKPIVSGDTKGVIPDSKQTVTPTPAFASGHKQVPSGAIAKKTSPENTHSRQPPPLTLESFLIRPAVKRPQKDSHKRKEVGKGKEGIGKLRDIELEQLQMRFPGDSCELLEKSKDHVSYLIHFKPTDQEWHGPDVILLKVNFLENYPEQFCQVELLADQDLLPESIEDFNRATQDYWTADMLGTLMLRPFFHWLDKNIVELLHIPSSDNDLGGHDSRTEEFGEDVSGSQSEEEECVEAEEKPALVKSKKGTEIRLVGLDTSQSLGTAYWSAVNVVLSCSRCKNHSQVELKEERLYSISCERCSNIFTAVYHTSLIHANSFTLGYLELASCTPVEVVFQSSALTMTCLNCSSQVTSTGFFIDQPKDEYCRRCHSKMTLSATGIRFIQHQQGEMAAGLKSENVTTLSSGKKATDLFKDGYPLPEYGVCQHYKKSHRWLRFPCCGRAFACDVCHDSVQDHPMDRATRMICGYCSKEQTYTVKGDCVRCGADLVSAKTTNYWEGGQGCRSKTKMHRLDRHKYKDSQVKTACKKAERVGKKNT